MILPISIFIFHFGDLKHILHGFMPRHSTADLYSLFAGYMKSSIPSAGHCTWPSLIWKRHSIVYPDMLSVGLSESLALRSGWCRSNRACMKMPEAQCVLVASKKLCVKVAVHQGPWLSPILFITVLGAQPKSFVQGMHGYTCMQMTWSSSVNRRGNCRRS